MYFCGAAAAGKSNFLNLLMKENFQPLHISTEVLKPQQVTFALKTVLSSNNNEVKFNKTLIDDEILKLESCLTKEYTVPLASLQMDSLQTPLQDNSSAINLPKRYTDSIATYKKYCIKATLKYPLHDFSADTSKLALSGVKADMQKFNKLSEEVWNLLSFMDTYGQPQVISMLPAVSSFAMITFTVHKMEKGGQSSLNKMVKVQYGNEKGEVSYKHKYTYLQLTETLISYASNILLPDIKFLDKVKIEGLSTRSLLLVGIHSGDNQLSENDIKGTDKELTKVVTKSGGKYVQPQVKRSYSVVVPGDNEKQGKYSKLQVIEENTKTYTNPSDIRKYILKFLNYQDKIHVPIVWLLLELQMRKVCQQKKSNLMSYDDVLKLAKERKLGNNGEFGDDVHINIDGEQFIKQGLRFHHSFGVLLYFEDVEGVQKLVITNHQWLFNKLSKIVEYSFTCEMPKDLKELKNIIFKKSLLGSDCLDIGKDFENSQINIQSVEPINAFLKLLEHLRIAAPSNDNASKYFMPCILDSCELSNFKEKVPQYNKVNDIEPLLIQFKSTNGETYSFPRGAFCFLVVELMVSMKWERYGQAFVNLITLFKKDTAHYVTLIDRFYCVEVYVMYKKYSNILDEKCEIIYSIVGKEIKTDWNLCHTSTYQLIKKVLISHKEEDNEWCPLTDLKDSHIVWLKRYCKVRMYDICTYVRMYHIAGYF